MLFCPGPWTGWAGAQIHVTRQKLCVQRYLGVTLGSMSAECRGRKQDWAGREAELLCSPVKVLVNLVEILGLDNLSELSPFWRRSQVFIARHSLKETAHQTGLRHSFLNSLKLCFPNIALD